MTYKEAYEKLCSILIDNVSVGEIMEKKFSFFSIEKFLNKKQSKLQSKEIFYEQVKIGNLFVKTHYSNDDLLINSKKIIDNFPQLALNFNIISNKEIELINVSNIEPNEDIKEELSEEQTTFYAKFWTEFLSKIGNYTTIYNNRNVSEKMRQWLSAGSSFKNCSYNCVVVSKYARIELFVRDKDLFDKLFSLKEEIEQAFGYELIWDSLEHRKGSRICIQKDGELFNFYDEFNWGRILNFFYTTIDSFIKAIQPALEKIHQPEFKHNSSELGLSFVEAAKQVLEENKNYPLTSAEIWQRIVDGKIPLKSKGSTPEITLNALLQRGSENTTYSHKNKPIFKVIENSSPAKFMLRRHVSKYVMESLEEYGFVHINQLKEILAKHGINI